MWIMLSPRSFGGRDLNEMPARTGDCERASGTRVGVALLNLFALGSRELPHSWQRILTLMAVQFTRLGSGLWRVH